MRFLLPAFAWLAASASAESQADAGSEASWLESAAHAFNRSLLWGTYRPNLYFGMRPRLPRSLMTGLIWWGAADYQGYSHARHTCEQSEELGGYAWTKHDGRNAGSQTIKDLRNNVVLTTEFLKVPAGEHGGSWSVRIKGEPLTTARPSRVSIMQYFGLEGLGGLELNSQEDEDGIPGPVELSGSTPHLGDFKIRIEDHPENRVSSGSHADDFGEMLERTAFAGLAVPPDNIWKAKDALLSSMTNRIQELLDKYPRESLPDPALLFALPNEVRYGANLFGFQRTYEGSFSIDVFFDGAGAGPPMDSESLTMGLEASFQAFDDRFARTFPRILAEYDASHVAFAQELTSSMLGGLGYFYGASIVDRNFAHDYDDDGLLTSSGDKTARGQEDPRLTEERELFTATPSRSFFPRGFYWDEGFHLLLIGSWDNDLSLDILGSWINLIDEDGWVGREQILGEEARSKVPREFQTQYPHHANPPTLTVAVTKYIQRLASQGTGITDGQLGLPTSETSQYGGSAALSNPEVLANRFVEDPHLAKAFLTSIYPKLRRHYNWFSETQRGQIREWGRTARSRTEAYRWRGRTEDHVLTSGLDDYPRARPPHPGELHLDLISWMGFFTRTMKEISEFVGEEDDFAEYDQIYKSIVANIDDLHWNDEKRMYCDASVDEDDESYHVCHKGYISIFPFMLQLLAPDSPRVDAILDDLADPEHLWSEYGIRSLAKSDPYFGQGENYWRGPVWVPMNYLVLSALHETYAKRPGPYQEKAANLYRRLRHNLVENVYKEWQRTGFTWEQFDAVTGEGRRSKPFTGWTSMVAMIMAEAY